MLEETFFFLHEPSKESGIWLSLWEDQENVSRTRITKPKPIKDRKIIPAPTRNKGMKTEKQHAAKKLEKEKINKCHALQDEKRKDNHKASFCTRMTLFATIME